MQFSLVCFLKKNQSDPTEMVIFPAGILLRMVSFHSVQPIRLSWILMLLLLSLILFLRRLGGLVWPEALSSPSLESGSREATKTYGCMRMIFAHGVNLARKL